MCDSDLAKRHENLEQHLKNVRRDLELSRHEAQLWREMALEEVANRSERNVNDRVFRWAIQYREHDIAEELVRLHKAAAVHIAEFSRWDGIIPKALGNSARALRVLLDKPSVVIMRNGEAADNG
jgi:hypothetical protein